MNEVRRKKSKKGLTLMGGANAVIALVFIGIVIGVGVLVLDSFSTSLTGDAVHAVNNATIGITSVGAQLPTVGLLVGVGLIFAALGLGIGFLLNRRGGMA